MVISKDDERRVRAAAVTTRSAVLALLPDPSIVDIALIGSAGEVYRWSPSLIVDFDCFVFVDALRRKAGTALEHLGNELLSNLGSMGVDFELRIIRGAYKPNRASGDPPILLLHLGVFTDETYFEESIIKRWAWRKYRCQVEESRLARLAPRAPVLDDLLHGPRGVTARLRDLRRGETTMCEWSLPDLAAKEISFDANSWVFTEFCYGSAATTARNHARILGYPEADQMSNDEFFAWYHRNVLTTDTLLPLMAMKRRARDEGFSSGDPLPRELCAGFLESVLASCMRSPSPVMGNG